MHLYSELDRVENPGGATRSGNRKRGYVHYTLGVLNLGGGNVSGQEARSRIEAGWVGGWGGGSNMLKKNAATDADAAAAAAAAPCERWSLLPPVYHVWVCILFTYMDVCIEGRSLTVFFFYMQPSQTLYQIMDLAVVWV